MDYSIEQNMCWFDCWSSVLFILDLLLEMLAEVVAEFRSLLNAISSAFVIAVDRFASLMAWLMLFLDMCGR
jgi:hypothetical protein